MFKKLLDFQHKRSAIQALGFYLFWLAIFLLTNGIITQMFVGFSGGGKLLGVGESFKYGIIIGAKISTVTAPLFSITIAILLIYKKQLPSWYYFIALVCGFLSSMTIILGLVPAAIISAREGRIQPS